MRQGMIASGLDESHDRVKKLEREILLRQDAMTFLRDGLNADSRGMMRGPQALEMEENLFLPLRDIPKVAQDYAILEKDVLVQKALMQLLLQQEAESLIESRNNTATVQVLDPAIPPEIKARPQRPRCVYRRRAEPLRFHLLHAGCCLRAQSASTLAGRSSRA